MTFPPWPSKPLYRSAALVTKVYPLCAQSSSWLRRSCSPRAANDHTVVYFDTTGDGRSDMLIALNGLKTLTAVDFIL